MRSVSKVVPPATLGCSVQVCSKVGLCQVSMREAEMDGENKGTCKEVPLGKKSAGAYIPALSSWEMWL